MRNNVIVVIWNTYRDKLRLADKVEKSSKA